MGKKGKVLQKENAGKSGFEGQNSESLTEKMHFYTLHELRRMNLCGELGACKILPEQSVVLRESAKRGRKPQAGKFDFLVELNGGQYLGIEVLTRPSKGKMLEKLRYAEQVDEFVFVLPSTALSIYRKPAKVFHKQYWGNALPREFAEPKIKAWLMDINTGKFIVKDLMSSVFSVE